MGLHLIKLRTQRTIKWLEVQIGNMTCPRVQNKRVHVALKPSRGLLRVLGPERIHVPKASLVNNVAGSALYGSTCRQLIIQVTTCCTKDRPALIRKWDRRVSFLKSNARSKHRHHSRAHRFSPQTKSRSNWHDGCIVATVCCRKRPRCQL